MKFFKIAFPAFRGLIDVIFIGAGILTLSSFFSAHAWLLELTSHFRFQYFIILVIAIVVYLMQKRKTFLYTGLILMLINLYCIAPWYIALKDNQNIQTNYRLSVMLINVRTQNTNYKAVRDYIVKVNPDVLALEEMNERWKYEMSDVLAGYKYGKMKTREDNFGIGLFSKKPLKNLQIKYYGQWSLPSIEGSIYIDNNLVDILLTHPVPPGSIEYFNARNEQLEEIASQRNNKSDRLIVIGDLNTSQWSHYYKKFVKDMDLYDTRRGFGLQPSWPAMFMPLLITIDHCLVSKNIKTIRRESGPDVGSDHYPVYVELGL